MLEEPAEGSMPVNHAIAPGFGTTGMVDGVIEEQHRQLHEFLFGEQSRSLAALSGSPVVRKETRLSKGIEKQYQINCT